MGHHARTGVRGAELFLLIALLPAACTRRTAPERPSFILVSIDTARRDAFGCNGYGRDTTPNIDALAARGLVFDRAVTLSCNTLISHATMLTGLHPAAHGATSKHGGVALEQSFITLAEDFQRAGYQTAGFTAHGDWLTARYGFHQGFDVFQSGYRSAEAVLSEARKWLLRRNPLKPFFLFVHLFDVHSDFGAAPYDSPPPFRGRYTGDYHGPLTPWEKQQVQGSRFLAAVRNGKIRITGRDRAYLKGLYDEGLAYTDDRLGAFLRAAKPLRNTYLWITADHGEEFQEHGGMLHGTSYDEVVRIPSILVPLQGCTDTLGAPRRVAAQVRTVDLRPTLLALAGLPAPRVCQGSNLLPWLRGEVDTCPAGPAFLNDNRAVRYRGFKYIRNGTRELYDLARDPGERRNLMQDPKVARGARKFEALLREQARKDRAIRDAHLRGAPPRPVVRDPRAAARLRRLECTR